MRPFKPERSGPGRNDIPDSPEEQALAAKKKALSLLEFQDRTESELRTKLKERGFSLDSVDAAVSYVLSFHYLDDRRYAENFVRSRADKKSRAELKMLLREKGVSDDIAVEVLENAGIDEAACVKELYLKKYARNDGDDPKLMEKALRYFAGKGYGYDAIRSGIEMALQEEE